MLGPLQLTAYRRYANARTLRHSSRFTPPLPHCIMGNLPQHTILLLQHPHHTLCLLYHAHCAAVQGTTAPPHPTPTEKRESQHFTSASTRCWSTHGTQLHVQCPRTLSMHGSATVSVTGPMHPPPRPENYKRNTRVSKSHQHLLLLKPPQHPTAFGPIMHTLCVQCTTRPCTPPPPKR